MDESERHDKGLTVRRAVLGQQRPQVRGEERIAIPHDEGVRVLHHASKPADATGGALDDALV